MYNIKCDTKIENKYEYAHITIPYLIKFLPIGQAVSYSHSDGCQYIFVYLRL